ncbi:MULTISPECIES: hypothetical protein [Nitrospirillum]|uniref:Uncharacterized protein n=1 Tax=Nitrospirillum amazonense TaxID=28077 RepID=A0A560GJI9_9PROT|nr:MULTISPECIES: hypothetical protein [Nitrospirillum]MDZ5646738.1 hypothetical protein [Nitrospirillum sp. BR 11828]TWB34086.1 hypothetical protein FBZ90_12720 [Nitrospirillum amazonense]
MFVPPTIAQAVPTPVLTPQQQTPTQNPSFVAAVAGAQSTAKPVATQTTAAAQPTGRSEGSKDNRSGTDTGQATDTGANAVRARSSGHPWRGQLLDVTV